MNDEKFMAMYKESSKKQLKQLRTKAILAVVQLAVFVIFAWVGVTSLIYAINNPKKTFTEVFLHMPKSAILIMKD